MKLNEIKIFEDNIESIVLSNTRIINCMNPHAYIVSKTDKIFSEALKTCDVLIPDGIGIVWSTRLLRRKKIKKIAGYDMFNYIMNYLNKSSGSCFFLGSSDDTLKKIKHKAGNEFPKVKVYSFSPPYKSEFSKEDSIVMCKKVNMIKPDILFVGMTAPKQEKWVYLNQNYLETKTICCIGAVFDFYSGNIKRSSSFWIKLGLEWLPRLIQEPRRLCRRNFISTPKFIIEVLFYKIFGKGIL